MFDLTGKKALITGASGGIGGDIARALHAQGATVALSHLDFGEAPFEVQFSVGVGLTIFRRDCAPYVIPRLNCGTTSHSVRGLDY